MTKASPKSAENPSPNGLFNSIQTYKNLKATKLAKFVIGNIQAASKMKPMHRLSYRSHTRPFQSIGLAFLLLGALGWSLVHAHGVLQYPLRVSLMKDKVLVQVRVSARQVMYTDNLKAPKDGPPSDDQLSRAAKGHVPYLLDHLQVRFDDKAVKGNGEFVKLMGSTATENDVEKIQAQFKVEYPFDPAHPPVTVGIYQDMLREYPYAPGEAWNITFIVEIRNQDDESVLNTLLPMDIPFVFKPGYGEKKVEAAPQATPQVVEEPSTVKKVDEPKADPPKERPQIINGLSELEPEKKHTQANSLFFPYLKEGMLHILTGYDHLLFVGALILAAATFWELFKVVLAFTLAHSLTLFLASMGWVQLPGWFVEPVISLSIVFVAAENFFFPSHRSGKIRLIVAFCFGLIHGMGYAGGLIDALQDLPSISFGTSLVAFSIGVELGHQVVILPVFGLLLLLRKSIKPLYFERGLQVGTLAISAGGVYFLVIALHQFIFRG